MSVYTRVVYLNDVGFGIRVEEVAGDFIGKEANGVENRKTKVRVMLLGLFGFS